MRVKDNLNEEMMTGTLKIQLGSSHNEKAHKFTKKVVYHHKTNEGEGAPYLHCGCC